MCEEILPPWLAAIRARHRHSVSAMPNRPASAAPPRRRPLHAVVGPRPLLGRREVYGYHVLVPELISAFNAPRHQAPRAKEAPHACRHTRLLANALRLSDVIFSDVSCASARRARQ